MVVAGGDQDGFDELPTTVDPGNAVLIGTILFSVALIAILPCIVAIGRRFQKHEEEPEPLTSDDNESSEDENSRRSKGNSTDTKSQKKKKKATTSAVSGIMAPYHARNDSDENDSVRSDASSVANALFNAILCTTPHGGPLRTPKLINMKNRDAKLDQVEAVEKEARSVRGNNDDAQSQAGDSILGRISNGAVSIRDAVDAHEAAYRDTDELMKDSASGGSCCASSAKTWKTLLLIAEWDYESKRLCRLGVPFVVQALLQGIMEAVRVAIIGQFIGTKALSAYLVIDLTIGLTTEFLGGFQEALTTLCSQAVGAGNNRLAGQYVQTAIFLFTICYVPVFIFWMAFIEDTLTWFGYDEETADIGKEFAMLFLFSNFIMGIQKAVIALMNVIELETYSTLIVMGQQFASTGFTVLVALKAETQSLQYVGLVFIGVGAVGLVVNTIIIAWKGWFDKYLGGMIGSFAVMNVKATKLLFKTSVALSFGQLFAYGEWEILTVFASFLGPYEVAAWGLLGTLWDAVELVTEAVADSAEVRTAYLLGSGQPAKAKLSSYKSIFLGTFTSFFITSLLFIAGEDIPTWMTRDPILQKMTADLIPLFGIGNIALTVGTVSWTIVGAQGRYRLATAVGFSGSWLIAIPLSVVVSIVLNWDLQGQTAAVVIGYMVSGTVNSYILLQSDWGKLSRRVIADVAASNDDSDDDSSSSSSSSSSNSEVIAPDGNVKSAKSESSIRGKETDASKSSSATPPADNRSISKDVTTTFERLSRSIAQLLDSPSPPPVQTPKSQQK